jgi:hypothetical protein
MNFEEASSSGWIIQPQVSSQKVTSCVFLRLLGGYNVLSSAHSIKKQYYNLPPHFEARIRINILKIDNWESGEIIILKVNGEIIRKIELNSYNNHIEAQLYCGITAEKDYLIAINEIFSHYDTSLDFEIKGSTIGTADEFWGINRFELVVYRCNLLCKNCQDAYKCTRCEPDMILVNSTCICKTG